MYAIHFRKSAGDREHYVVIKDNIRTLQEAKDNRWASGDLVVYSRTGEVVQNEDWLWDWEYMNEHCYARQAINDAARKSR